MIYACGLNNYGQLALVKQPQKLPATAEVKEELSESMLAKKQGPLIQFMLTPANGFDPEKNWTQFAIGMHHTLALTESGKNPLSLNKSIIDDRLILLLSKCLYLSVYYGSIHTYAKPEVIRLDSHQSTSVG